MNKQLKKFISVLDEAERYLPIDKEGRKYGKQLKNISKHFAKTLRTIEIQYYSANDFPSIDEIIEKDGKKYKVIDNSIRNVTTAKLVSN